MAKVGRLAVLVLAVQALPVAAQSDAIAGRWATQGFGSIVEMQSCKADRTAICGRVRWLWDASDEAGHARVDGKNPDKALRSRPIIGIEIMRGFRETAPGVWTGGSIYNPDDGRTYTGTIRLRHGMLVLKGCAFGIICQTQNWRRPDEVFTAARKAWAWRSTRQPGGCDLS